MNVPKETLKSLVRYVLGFVAGALLSRNIITPELAGAIVSTFADQVAIFLVTVVIPIVWIWAKNLFAKRKLDAALDLPSGSSYRQLNRAVKDPSWPASPGAAVLVVLLAAGSLFSVSCTSTNPSGGKPWSPPFAFTITAPDSAEEELFKTVEAVKLAMTSARRLHERKAIKAESLRALELRERDFKRNALLVFAAIETWRALKSREQFDAAYAKLTSDYYSIQGGAR